jgi:hypothetical protein
MTLPAGFRRGATGQIYFANKTSAFAEARSLDGDAAQVRRVVGRQHPLAGRSKKKRKPRARFSFRARSRTPYWHEAAARVRSRPVAQPMQRKFVRWWKGAVERKGGDRKSDNQKPRSRFLKCADAEGLTGMKQQRFASRQSIIPA